MALPEREREAWAEGLGERLGLPVALLQREVERVVQGLGEAEGHLLGEEDTDWLAVPVLLTLEERVELPHLLGVGVALGERELLLHLLGDSEELGDLEERGEREVEGVAEAQRLALLVMQLVGVAEAQRLALLVAHLVGGAVVPRGEAVAVEGIERVLEVLGLREGVKALESVRVALEQRLMDLLVQAVGEAVLSHVVARGLELPLRLTVTVEDRHRVEVGLRERVPEPLRVRVPEEDGQTLPVTLEAALKVAALVTAKRLRPGSRGGKAELIWSRCESALPCTVA